MRAALVVALLLSACTADNPEFCGPRGAADCVSAIIYVQPDLTGYVIVPAPDMTVPPDLTPQPPDFGPPFPGGPGADCQTETDCVLPDGGTDIKCFHPIGPGRSRCCFLDADRQHWLCGA